MGALAVVERDAVVFIEFELGRPLSGVHVQGQRIDGLLIAVVHLRPGRNDRAGPREQRHPIQRAAVDDLAAALVDVAREIVEPVVAGRKEDVGIDGLSAARLRDRRHQQLAAEQILLIAGERLLLVGIVEIHSAHQRQARVVGDARTRVGVRQQRIAKPDELAIRFHAGVAVFPRQPEAPDAVEPKDGTERAELNPTLVEFRRQIGDMHAATQIVHIGHELIAAANRGGNHHRQRLPDSRQIAGEDKSRSGASRRPCPSGRKRWCACR